MHNGLQLLREYAESMYLERKEAVLLHAIGIILEIVLILKEVGILNELFIDYKNTMR